MSAIVGVMSILSPLGRISTARVNRALSPAGSTVPDSQHPAFGLYRSQASRPTCSRVVKFPGWISAANWAQWVR